MGHDQTANKEADNGHQRGQLQITQSGNGMTGSAAVCPAGAKTNQQASAQQYAESFQGKDICR